MHCTLEITKYFKAEVHTNVSELENDEPSIQIKNFHEGERHNVEVIDEKEEVWGVQFSDTDIAYFPLDCFDIVPQCSECGCVH